MDNMKHRHLQELDRSDFRIADGEPDIRGWDVKTPNAQKIGAVEELILDAREKKVRYMVVDLDDNELKLQHRKVLIPIGLAELDKDYDDVIIPNVSSRQFDELPVYDRNQLTPEAERKIFTTLTRSTETPVKDRGSKTEMERLKSKKARENLDELDPEFYRHEYYNVDNLYKNRMHEGEPVNKKKESEYERGLKLWERRSEGTVLPDDSRAVRNAKREREESSDYPEMNEDARREMIRNRRNNYQERRYKVRDDSQARIEPDIDKTRSEG